MSQRKVKDAKDLDTDELIYFKGHAKATYMSDGRSVEEAINQVGTGGGGVVVETDPIFSASAAAKITDNNISAWNNKVDKVDGKQLSTEDFTTLLKQKLEGLSNYDDTEIQEAVSKLRTDLDTLVSGDTTTAINTFNEVIAFLDGIQDTQDLSSIIASIEQQIAAKGTYSKPSTGIPKTDLASAVQTSLGKADTALQSYTEQYKGTVTGVKINGSTKSPSSGVVDLGTVITSHQDISGKMDKISVQNHGTSSTTLSIAPNVLHKWDTVLTLVITLIAPTDTSVYNEYMIQFSSGSTPTTLSVPSAVKWVSEPKIEANKTYQISIMDNIGIIVWV